MLVVLLLGIILLREPRIIRLEDRFLVWLLEHAQTSGRPVPLTVVEIGGDALTTPRDGKVSPRPAPAAASAISPLEFALFLQSVLDFQPSVVAFENILKWRGRDKDQEQVFLDQAMRVPKLLLASELDDAADPDASWGEIRGFSDVTGRRGDLAPFAGIARQPSEDLRLISTRGYTNLPDDYTSPVRVPLLFLYRGEVIPSFPLQAILLWLRVTPAEVKVVLGSHIALPHKRRIPIQADGTLLIDPNAGSRGRRMKLNELLLAAQQKEAGKTDGQPATDMTDHVVLARTPSNPLSPPDLFAATIATIQGNRYLHRVTWLFDCAILLLVGALATSLRRFARTDLVLYGIAFTAAYCLVALASVARLQLWLPGVLPLGAIWLAILAAFILGPKQRSASAGPGVIPPPVA